ncbi:hypothetical protein D3C78_820260 [compost metagenome]
MHLLLIALHCLEVLLRVQRDPVQVVIVERQAAQWRVRRLRQVFQRLGIEGRLHGLAIIRSPRASLGIEQHAAVGIADCQHQHLQVTAGQALGNVVKLLGCCTIGDQQQGARHFFGIKQLFRLIDHAKHVLAGLLDQVGRQCLQKGVEQRRVFGGGQHQVRAAGVSN